jgi:hypothetical protein
MLGPAASGVKQQVQVKLQARATVAGATRQGQDKRMHRRHTKFIIVLVSIAAAMAGLRSFGNWSPAYKPLLPPIYVILIGVAVWYSARWLQPRTKHERREGDRRHAKRRVESGK